MLAAIEGPDILIVIAVVLLLFGSTQIPKLARSLGSASREFKKGQEQGHPVEEPVAAAPVVAVPVVAPKAAAPVVAVPVVAPTPAAPVVAVPVVAPTPAAPVVAVPVVAPKAAAPVVESSAANGSGSTTPVR